MRGTRSGLRRSKAWNGFFERAPGSRQRNGKAASITTHEAIENPLGECSLIAEDERIPTVRLPFFTPLAKILCTWWSTQVTHRQIFSSSIPPMTSHRPSVASASEPSTFDRASCDSFDALTACLFRIPLGSLVSTSTASWHTAI